MPNIGAQKTIQLKYACRTPAGATKMHAIPMAKPTTAPSEAAEPDWLRR